MEVLATGAVNDAVRARILYPFNSFNFQKRGSSSKHVKIKTTLARLAIF